MRSISVRALESTPGQLYCRRSEPEISSTRKGRSAVGSFPFSSFGFMSAPANSGLPRIGLVAGKWPHFVQDTVSQFTRRNQILFRFLVLLPTLKQRLQRIEWDHEIG